MESVHPHRNVRKSLRLTAGLWLLLLLVAPAMQAQGGGTTQDSRSTRIIPRLVVLSESVVREQWAHNGKMVNAPRNITQLNPGQCVRLGIYATGENQQKFLEDTTLTFYAEFASQKVVHQSVSLSETKQIKPVGTNFTSTSRATEGSKPLSSTYSMGATRLNWCVPVDASDGTATLEADVDSAEGRQVLKSSPIHIQSFETGSKVHFKTNKEFEVFLPTYYRQPNTARLLPVLQFMVAEQAEHPQVGFEENISEFLVAALKANPLAAEDFQMRIASQPEPVRMVGVNVLRSAGHYVDGLVNSWSADEQKRFQSMPALADPFDLTPTAQLPRHLDMLWSMFWATGQLGPVKAIASELEWAADYTAWDKAKKSGALPTTLTASFVRGQSYQAAGRSLAAFQRNNPLVADYIDYLVAAPDTSASVRSALKGLGSNPIFKQPAPAGTKSTAAAPVPAAASKPAVQPAAAPASTKPAAASTKPAAAGSTKPAAASGKPTPASGKPVPATK